MTTLTLAAVQIVALTPAGADLGHRLCQLLSGATLWLPPRLLAGYPGARPLLSLKALFQEVFQEKRPLVAIMATGIVVRHLAPWLRGKDQDPAVVVMDERGRFAISLLSGHLGGANELARGVAGLLGAVPVITTATDVQGLPALDSIAARRGWAIENLTAVKDIHAALLQGQRVLLVDPLDCLREELAPWPELFDRQPETPAALERPGPAVYVGSRDWPWPAAWLRLRPKILVAGVGCNRGASSEEILALVAKTCQQFHLAPLSLKSLASISAKEDEAGLRAAARQLGVPCQYFSPKELQAISVPNPSAVVQRHLGVASVCEAAALRAAAGGPLLVPKQKSANVTLAVAQVASIWSV